MMERSFSVDDLIAPLWGFGSSSSMQDLLRKIPSRSGFAGQMVPGALGSNGDLAGLPAGTALGLFQPSLSEKEREKDPSVHELRRDSTGGAAGQTLPRVGSLDEFLRIFMNSNSTQPPTPTSRVLTRNGERPNPGPRALLCGGRSRIPLRAPRVARNTGTSSRRTER